MTRKASRKNTPGRGRLAITLWPMSLLEIADDGSNDSMMRQQSADQSYAANREHIQRSRLRLDTRKWLLSKALPKIYGDKLPVETNTEPQVIWQVRHTPYEGVDRNRGFG